MNKLESIANSNVHCSHGAESLYSHTLKEYKKQQKDFYFFFVSISYDPY